MTALSLMELRLPKEYFSYSQMSLWLRDPAAYRERYYNNGPSLETRETIFGKKIAKMLEDGVADPVLNRVPRYSEMEHKIELSLGPVPFMGYLDSFDPKTRSIIEYKTGRAIWNPVRVRKHDQLSVYSLLVKEKYGSVNADVILVWMETQWKQTMQQVGSTTMLGDSGELEFSGRVEIFERSISEWERKRIKKIIIDTAYEISKDYQKVIHR